MQHNPSIGIIGYGFVGQAVAYGFRGYNVFIHDKYKPSLPLRQVAEVSNILFICVPTPMMEDESGIRLDELTDVFEQLARIPHLNTLIVIKSTVPPGTTKALQERYQDLTICFNPEFLTEANYLDDFNNQERIIIGKTSHSYHSTSSLAACYHDRFPHAQIEVTDSTTAELVKYATNAYLSMKVTFANELFDICNKLGISYGELKKLLTLDKRISPSHLNVTAERGFGGKCLPKDLVGLIAKARELQVDTTLLSAVWQKNKAIRRST